MSPPPGPARPALPDLARTTLSVLSLGVLIGTSLWVLQPFLGPAVWATMIVVATWPLLQRLQRLLGGRRALAVALLLLALLLLMVVPLTLTVATLVTNADRIVAWARAVAGFRLGDPPAWLAALPVIGAALAAFWRELAAAGVDDVLARLQPYAGNATKWLIGEVGGLGYLIVQFMMTVLLAGVMYWVGEPAAHVVRRLGRRLAGERGRHVVGLAADAIRGVALGVGVTALLQAVLAGIGLALAGVPFAGLLTGLMLLLCIAQIGALPVLLPAAAWVIWSGSTGWGIFLLVWSGIVAGLDNVLRPLLIRLGADLPLLLIFAGVIGGLLAFGLVGVFVGPVVLAVAWTLLQSWLDDGDILPPTEPTEPPPP